jgi:hypothetical protein
MSIHVFAGPTISAEEARQILDVHYLPPASQGDVFRLVATTDVSVIGLIDGNFREVPAVWHKELLWAMSQGVQVVGAASMGALRAAELAEFGMVGEGCIFEAYRSGILAPYGDVFEDDDEVAVIHAPAELGYRPMSDALVDMRCTFDLATKHGVISTELRDRLTSLGKSLYYADRSYNAVIEMARRDGSPAAELERLRDWLPDGCVSRKKQDAVAMLARIRAGDFARGVEVSYDFHHTTMWDALTGETLTDRSALAQTPLTAEDQAVFGELQLRPDEFLDLKDDAERALRIGDCPPVRRVILAMLDKLRAQGRYAAFAARADRKNSVLSHMQVPRAADLSPLQMLQLFDWYFDRRLGQDMPDDVDACARLLGYADRNEFAEALLREYAFVTAEGEGKSRPPRSPDHESYQPEG